MTIAITLSISPAGARVLQQLPSVKQYGAMPTGSQYCLVCSDFGMHAHRVGDKRVLSRATQRVHSTALHRLLLHQPGRRARVHVHKAWSQRLASRLQWG